MIFSDYPYIIMILDQSRSNTTGTSHLDYHDYSREYSTSHFRVSPEFQLDISFNFLNRNANDI